MFCRTNFWTSAGCFEPDRRASRGTRATDEDFADLQRILDAQQRKLKKGQSAIVETPHFTPLARSHAIAWS